MREMGEGKWVCDMRVEGEVGKKSECIATWGGDGILKWEPNTAWRHTHTLTGGVFWV